MDFARSSSIKFGHAGSVLLIVFATAVARGQSMSDPIKPGLWETQVTSSVQMTLPPEVEAKIAAMREAGIFIAESPSALGSTMVKALQG